MKIDVSKQIDLIEAIFDLSGLERITKDSGKINTSFYRLKQEFPLYFENLMFNTNCQSPTSKEIEGILSIFKLSGMLSVGELGIFGEYYKWHKDEEYAERIKEQLPDIDISEIRIIADKFREYVQ